MNGDNVVKNGCTDFIIQILVNDKYTDKIEKIEFAYERLLNDENIEIVRKLGRCITSKNYWTKLIVVIKVKYFGILGRMNPI